MDAHVLVPLKATDPKSRLSGALGADERAELMRGLLERVVGVVHEAGVERVTVVTVRADRGLRGLARPRPRVERGAGRRGRGGGREPARRVRLGRPAAAPRRGGRGAARGHARSAGSRSHARWTAERTRSSMRPPGLVRTCFGQPGSAAVHAGLGVPHVVVDLPGLAFDVDTPADLEKMQAACR